MQPLSLEELLAKKKAEEEAESKVRTKTVLQIVEMMCKIILIWLYGFFLLLCLSYVLNNNFARFMFTSSFVYLCN